MGKIKIALGQHSINLILKDIRLNFKFFPKKLNVNAKKEYEFLKRIHKSKIPVPKPYSLIETDNSSVLVREFINGITFGEFLTRANVNELKSVLIKIVLILKKLEELGIFVPEFSSLYKNVIVCNDVPYLIDLERGRFGARSNVTQFLGFLIKLFHNPKLSKKLSEILNIEKLKSAAREYKTLRDISLVLQAFVKTVNENVTNEHNRKLKKGCEEI